MKKADQRIPPIGHVTPKNAAWLPPANNIIGGNFRPLTIKRQDVDLVTLSVQTDPLKTRLPSPLQHVDQIVRSRRGIRAQQVIDAVKLLNGTEAHLDGRPSLRIICCCA